MENVRYNNKTKLVAAPSLKNKNTLQIVTCLFFCRCLATHLVELSRTHRISRSLIQLLTIQITHGEQYPDHQSILLYYRADERI